MLYCNNYVYLSSCCSNLHIFFGSLSFLTILRSWLQELTSTMSIKKRPSKVLKAAKSVFKSYNGTRLFYLGFFYFSSCGSLNAPFLVGIFVYLLAVVGTPICVWAGTSLDFPDPLPTLHRLCKARYLLGVCLWVDSWRVFCFKALHNSFREDWYLSMLGRNKFGFAWSIVIEGFLMEK